MLLIQMDSTRFWHLCVTSSLNNAVNQHLLAFKCRAPASKTVNERHMSVENGLRCVVWANICCPLRLPTKMLLITSMNDEWPGLVQLHLENEVITRDTSRECPSPMQIVFMCVCVCFCYCLIRHKIDSITWKSSYALFYGFEEFAQIYSLFIQMSFARKILVYVSLCYALWLTIHKKCSMLWMHVWTSLCTLNKHPLLYW